MADLLERLKAALADRYRVDREIGRGGMAHVFLAQDLKLDRPVALKVLRPELAVTLGGDRFLQEITLSAKLDHPHILPLLDSGEADGTLFYTMPFVEGESLRDRLDREGQLPLEEALQLTREVADALSHAHSRGIIHRDMKPENILLAGGHARVADFGIAKAVTEAGGENLTGTGVSIGTPAYMSPEQAEATKPVDGRSDLYSLGCVLYEMLAGHPPFAGSTAHELIARHATDPVPSLRTGRTTVPEPIEAAVEKALAKVPADRFTTVQQFGHALGPGPWSYASQPVRGRWKSAVGAAVGTLAVAAIAGTWVLTGAPDVPELGRPLPYTVLADVAGSAPEETRQAVREHLGVALERAGLMQALPTSLVHEGLVSALLPDSIPVSESLARELAVRGFVPTVVVPKLDRLGGRYSLLVRVIVALPDSTLAVTRVDSEGDPQVLAMVDGAVEDLRSQLRTHAETMAQWRAIRFWAITPSFEAVEVLRHCSADPDVVSCYRRALALDSAFARVWYGMGFEYLNRGAKDSGVVAFRQALRYPERLPPDARRNLEGTLAFTIGDLVTAARAWSINPNDPTVPMVNYPTALFVAGQVEDARRAWRTLEERASFPIDPNSMFEIGRTFVAMGRLDSARTVADRLADSPSPAWSRFALEQWIRLAQQDWDAVDSAARLLMRRVQAPPRDRLEAAVSMASVRAARGAVTQAEASLQPASGPDRTSISLRTAAMRARALLWLVSGIPPSASVVAADTVSSDAAVHTALLAAASGDTLRARMLLERMLTGDLAELRAQVYLGPLQVTRAILDARAEAWRDVLADLRPCRERTNLWRNVELLTRWLTATAFEQLGQVDSAIAYLQRIVHPQPLWDEWMQLGIPYSFAHFRLGRLYTELEQHDRAEEHYLSFIDTFTQPDPEYEWMTTEARAKLEELARGR